MGTAPIKVRAWFEEDSRSKCEPCLLRLKGLATKSALRSAVRALVVEDFLVEEKGRCSVCRRNAVVWRVAPSESEERQQPSAQD